MLVAQVLLCGFGQCVVADTTMALFQWLFGVVVFTCVTAQRLLPLQKHQPLLPAQQQLKAPLAATPFDKCQVEEAEKIQCGTQDITAEQCENINCCFDRQQCYYGKAGMWAPVSGASCAIASG